MSTKTTDCSLCSKPYFCVICQAKFVLGCLDDCASKPCPECGDPDWAWEDFPDSDRAWDDSPN